MRARNQILLALVCLEVTSRGQGPQATNSQFDQALREYQAGRYAQAEQGLREVVRRDPSDIFAQFYLGQSLFREEKYPDAVGPFERARELERNGKALSSDQRRILTDQLVIAYGVSGQLKKTHALLDEAIKQDPEYPLNYYNLACAFAEESDKGNMLANLTVAFQHKAQVLKGEQMPDPRSDSSFEKYVRDADFIKLMKELGYK